MLVRRTVLNQLGGFDQQLPIFGNDIDFGWRAAAGRPPHDHRPAGGRLPRRGRPPRRPAYADHRPAHALPGAPGRALHAARQLARPGRCRSRLVRLGLGTLLRMLGFLLTRQVGQALDELAALVSVYSSPRELLAARRTRRGEQVADADEVRRCWRRGGCPTGTASTSSATCRRPPPTRPPTSPSDAGRRSSPSPASAPRRVVRGRRRGVRPGHRAGRPVLHQPGGGLGDRLFVILALVGARDAFGSVAGGALSPGARRRPGDWWRLHAESLAPARPGHRRARARRTCCRWPLAATLLGGSPGAAISALLVLAVPFSLWGAWRFLRVVGRLVDPRGFATPLLAWGAVDLRADPGRQRRLGRGPVRRRRRDRPAAVAGPRRARLRRPRAGPPLAGRLALRRCCSRSVRRSRRCCSGSASCSRWSWSAPGSRSARG